MQAILLGDTPLHRQTLVLVFVVTMSRGIGRGSGSSTGADTMGGTGPGHGGR